MSCKIIISDWHGTIFKIKTDEKQNKYIGLAILNKLRKDLFRGNISKIYDLFKLFKIKKDLQKKTKQYEQGQLHIWDVYKIFNKEVINGQPIELIENTILYYAKSASNKVDKRILDCIEKYHNKGIVTAILSCGYDKSINAILEYSGYNNLFDRIIANTITSKDDKAEEFTLNVYEEKDKIIRQEFLDKYKPEEIIYIGDTDDDELAAKILPKGNYIVSFMAEYEYKQRMKEQYSAFVPKTEEDLEMYLESVFTR